MSKLDLQNINVLNYNENEVFVDSSREHYKFGASRDGINPTIVPMSISELQYIASNTEIIKTGWLTFDDEHKEEIFKELRFPNWESILSNKDIEDILTHPTLNGLQKIIDIENQTYFDRVRIIMFKLLNDGVDVTTKVSNIVDQRYNELRKKQRKSNIILRKKDTDACVTQNDIRELSKENESLKLQMLEMKQLMEQLIPAQAKQDENADQAIPKEPASKKTGRPSTKKVSE